MLQRIIILENSKYMKGEKLEIENPFYMDNNRRGQQGSAGKFIAKIRQIHFHTCKCYETRGNIVTAIKIFSF